ncbi:MAG TPA: hypothetical protein VG538_00765 [Vicinamibacterales bacterium]|jgi:hypothetical protein|nr:hypothetical protein [Vicinamibacterales bacterium]
MLSRRVRHEPWVIGGRPVVAILAVALCGVAAPLFAQTASPPVSVGAGLQTSFLHDAPDGGESSDRFLLNSVRLYVNGSSADKVKFTFNTEYDGGTNHLTVLDAVARFEVSDRFNVWVGRMLPPSDRANLYGPYYANEWAVYSDGLQDGYPFVATGRDNGVAYWGQFGPVKVQGGAYDGASADGNDKVIAAGRVMVDFWDPEPGYYLNGTYYGDKNILAVGAAGQVQDGNTAWSADLLLERKVAGGGAFTIESEYAAYSQLGGYDAQYEDDKGAYGLASYLFPKMGGLSGQFEVLGKYAQASFSHSIAGLDDYKQRTTELNFDYVLKQFNARVMLFYKHTDFTAVKTDDQQIGVGLQVQM